jgi:type IV secretory pathway VirB10-like protein
MSDATTYLPPRQPHRPVQRIAKWALITIATVVVGGALYLFFRGTTPRYLKLTDATPAAHVSPIADGWVQGLPDTPAPHEPPPKPLPPVDEQARRELLRLQQQMRDRDEQMNKTLDELRKLLAQRQPPAPAAKPMKERQMIKRAPMLVISHERKDDEVPADTDLLLTPGTWIPAVLETTLNSEIEGYFTLKTRKPVYDSVTGQRVVIPQGQAIVARDTSAALLFGNERIPTFAVSLSLPGGRSVELGDAPIMDATGTNGLTGEVNNHIWRLVWTSIFIGGLRGGQQALQAELAQDGTTYIVNGIAQQGSSVALQRLGRAQDTRPTITVRPGELVNVLITKTFRMPQSAVAQR